MKIKRYTAVTMRAAVALVRAEQGPDAVILSSRRGEDGIEVIAAVDYDEALFVAATRQPTPAAEASTAEVAAAPAPAHANQPAAAAARTPARTSAAAPERAPAVAPATAAAPTTARARAGAAAPPVPAP